MVIGAPETFDTPLFTLSSTAVIGPDAHPLRADDPGDPGDREPALALEECQVCGPCGSRAESDEKRLSRPRMKLPPDVCLNTLKEGKH